MHQLEKNECEKTMPRTWYQTGKKPLERRDCLRNYTQKAKLKKTSSLRRSTEIWPWKSAGKQLHNSGEIGKDIRENPRDFFNTLQPFIRKKTAKNNPTTLNIDGNDGDYFANVALDIEGQHLHDLLEEDHQYHTSIESIKRQHHDTALDFNFQAITETDVSDVIENINPRKSSGWDSPTVPILLKKTASAIAPSLGAIFNHCPKREWTPVFKKKDKQAKLPLLGKVFEHLLFKQITTIVSPIQEWQPIENNIAVSPR